ncbi:MAG: hypothetical protein FJ118_12460 [Deltaproteobacteria bacterium]|nr:hypothetical protein [Deltaproteobacteria bacterium]
MRVVPQPDFDPLIIVDSREQRLLEFSVPTITGTLSVGDYSIVGLEDRISIERKSLNDLVNSFTTGRKRFEKEFHRARSLDFFAVVVESAISDLFGGQYNSNANPEAMFQSIMSWTAKYKRPFLFSENRSIAARIIQSLLGKYAHQFLKAADNVTRAAQRLQNHIPKEYHALDFDIKELEADQIMC